jgi:hypothetical protein
LFKINFKKIKKIILIHFQIIIIFKNIKQNLIFKTIGKHNVSACLSLATWQMLLSRKCSVDTSIEIQFLGWLKLQPLELILWISLSLIRIRTYFTIGFPCRQGGAFLATSTVVWRPEARGQIICAESHVTMMYLGDHFVFSLFCGFSFSFGIVFVLHPVTSILYKKTYDAFVNWWWLIFLCSHASSLLSDQWLITRLARKILLFPRKRKNLKSCTEWNHGAYPVIMVLMHGHLWPW